MTMTNDRDCGAAAATDAGWSTMPETDHPPALQLHPPPSSAAATPVTVCQPLDDEPASAEPDDQARSTRMIAALFAVLHRYTGQAELTIGDADAEGRMTALDVVIGDGSGFAALVQQVARARADCRPAATDIAAAGTRSGHRHAVAWSAGSAEPAQADLCLALARRDGRWTLRATFRSDRHSVAAIECWLRHLLRLLRAGSADGRMPIALLPMLDDAERQALIAEGNQTAVVDPRPSTVIERFRRQVRLRPHAWAVVDGRQRMRYRAIEQAIDALAARLRWQGIGPGNLVAVCLERDIALPIALLAVLATGAAYLPMDPRYPLTRLRQMLDNAEPALLLTQTTLREALPTPALRRLLIDDREPDPPPGAIAGSSAQRPDEADELAYLIYTSGSTGQPKGVPIHRRALANVLQALGRMFAIVPGDRWLAVSTVSFDIATLELLLPLVSGATVVIAADADIVDGSALRSLLDAHRITVMQATPVSWQLLLKAGWRAPPGFRMLCGGEALPRPLAERLLAGGGTLWNLYGPTETTIWSSALKVASGSGAVPIGPPIANTRFHVLDGHGGLIPAGQAGELYIGGDGVGQGYLRLPVLSARHFVLDPFDATHHGRLYRTGDRVRHRPDGSFDFLGRVDRQLKLRGHRIEPGDLEAALLVQPGIEDCVVVIGPDARGDDALLAYVAAAEAHRPDLDLALLRLRLRQLLPAYLCPSAIIVVAELPRLANRKIDRTRLPSATVAHRHGAGTGDPEQRLARHWRAVLGDAADGSRAVDPGSHFFEAGGHSLLAADLLGRIESEFGIRLGIATLFAQPTFSGLLAQLTTGRDRAHDFSRVVRMQAGGSGVPLIALNNTGNFYGLAHQLGDAQPFISLQVFDPAQPPEPLPQGLGEIAARYVALIREIRPVGPYQLIGWCVAGVLAHEVARQLLAAGESVQRLILIDTWAPDYRRRLPWWRSRLAEYASRWHLIAADWRRSRAGRQSVWQFLARRSAFQSLRRLLTPGPAVLPPVRPQDQHEQWLLRHLEAAAEAFAPGRLPGGLLLLRSSEEPAGRFLDPEMGWGRHVEGAITVAVLPGSHFGIFQPPAVRLMADAISAFRP